jgi:tight adherence protein B
MVNALPYAIFAGSAIAVALLFFAVWDWIRERATIRVKGLSNAIDRAGMRRSPEEWVFNWAAVSVLLWFASLLVLHPSLLIGCLLLPLSGLICAGGVLAVVRISLRRRIAKFTQQLELALRLMSSALRVGLGLRQAIALAVDEMPEPSRSEYMRIIGQVNIGISIFDALDDLAERMTGNETQMFARVVRIQSQTGGDLSRVLEQLANTIKERRKMRRKISALTSEGRAGSVVLIGIPVFLSFIISMVQPRIGHALFMTPPGHVALTIVVILELLAFFSLRKILKVDFA